MSAGEDRAVPGPRERERYLRQRVAAPGAGGRPSRRRRDSGVAAGKGHPSSGEPVLRPAPSPAGAAAATLGPLWPGGAAATESCFCAAAPAPVSLTLEPAAYLSNSKGNSAAAEGKKITSAAELGGRRPQPGPCFLCCPAQHSQPGASAPGPPADLAAGGPQAPQPGIFLGPRAWDPHPL